MSKILIIDDEDHVREELGDRLDSMGIEWEEASCQEGAMRMLAEIDYDLVLLDLAIPVRFEGVVRVEHGRNLLQQIVSLPGAPPVIVITANGLCGHKLAVEMMTLGAKSFVAKPFDDDPIEPKVRMFLDDKHSRAASTSQNPPFEGGVLTLHRDCIELCGKVVGGTRGNGYIRKIIHCLMMKKDGKYPKCSGAQLAEAIGGTVEAPSMASAIKDFRNICTEKLGCGKNDVIETVSGGGYRLADRIEVKLGREEGAKAQIDLDKELVVRQLKRFGKRTRRQISDVANITAARARAALSALDDEGVLSKSGSGSDSTYELRDIA